MLAVFLATSAWPTSREVDAATSASLTSLAAADAEFRKNASPSQTNLAAADPEFRAKLSSPLWKLNSWQEEKKPSAPRRVEGEQSASSMAHAMETAAKEARARQQPHKSSLAEKASWKEAITSPDEASKKQLRNLAEQKELLASELAARTAAEKMQRRRADDLGERLRRAEAAVDEQRKATALAQLGQQQQAQQGQQDQQQQQQQQQQQGQGQGQQTAQQSVAERMTQEMAQQAKVEQWAKQLQQPAPTTAQQPEPAKVAPPVAFAPGVAPRAVVMKGLTPPFSPSPPPPPAATPAAKVEAKKEEAAAPAAPAATPSSTKTPTWPFPLWTPPTWPWPLPKAPPAPPLPKLTPWTPTLPAPWAALRDGLVETWKRPAAAWFPAAPPSRAVNLGSGDEVAAAAKPAAPAAAGGAVTQQGNAWLAPAVARWQYFAGAMALARFEYFRVYLWCASPRSPTHPQLPPPPL